MDSSIFGYELCLDLFDCDLATIKSKAKLIQYLMELCVQIDMKRYGSPMIKWFGSGDIQGYSMMQLIETSSIVGHFSEKKLTAYLNIFSCKEYDVDKAAQFTKQFFKAGSVKSTYLVR